MVDFDQVNQGISSVFGECLVYQSAYGGNPVPVSGVFTDAYQMAFQDGNGKVGWTTTAPSVGIRLADLPLPPVKNDRITRLSTGELFLVFDKQPNGIGWVNLLLKAS